MRSVFTAISASFCMLVLVCAFAKNVEAQTNYREFAFDTTKTYIVQLIDGTEFVGMFIGKGEHVLLFQTSSIPRIEIPYEQIKSVALVQESSMKGSTYWHPNPNATRYFFAPSGFNLKKGEGYYQNSYLVLNSVNVGVTDYFSIGGSIELLSTFGSLASGTFDPIVIITPKVGFPVGKNVHAGGGLLFVSIPSFDSDPRTGAGIAYAITTLGNFDHNATLGIGWGFIDNDWAQRPVVTVSGMTRVSANVSLVTENWIVPLGDELQESIYNGLYSYGVRFFGKKLSVDLALINNAEIADVFVLGVPYVDFVVKF